MTDDVPVDSFSRDCPDCGATVPEDAPRCADCGATLDPETAADSPAARGVSSAGQEAVETVRGVSGTTVGGTTNEGDGWTPDGADGRTTGDASGGTDEAAPRSTGIDDGVTTTRAAGDDATDDASRVAFAVAVGALAYLYVSYALYSIPATNDVAASTPVLVADIVAFVVLPLATLADATLVRRSGGWSPRRWVWVPLVAVPLLGFLTAPAYLLVRYSKT